MTKTEGIRLVSELEAERVLLARGYTKANCSACAGKGHTVYPGQPAAGMAVSSFPQKLGCNSCESQGWTWVPPSAVPCTQISP